MKYDVITIETSNYTQKVSLTVYAVADVLFDKLVKYELEIEDVIKPNFCYDLTWVAKDYLKCVLTFMDIKGGFASRLDALDMKIFNDIVARCEKYNSLKKLVDFEYLLTEEAKQEVINTLSKSGAKITIEKNKELVREEYSYDYTCR